MTRRPISPTLSIAACCTPTSCASAATSTAKHMREIVPNVLSFPADLVMRCDTLPQPVNYGLARTTAPAGTPADESKRLFIVVDPRVGHGCARYFQPTRIDP